MADKYQSRAEGLPECARNACTLRGLAAVRADRPGGWHHVLVSTARLAPARSTLGQVLQGGGEGLLLPRCSEPSEAARLKKQRHLARRLVRVYGRLSPLQIGDEWLHSERRRLRGGRHPISASQEVVGAAFTLLRQVVYRFQERHGWLGQTSPRLAPRAQKRIGPRRGAKRQVQWAELVQFWHVAPLRLRAAVALQICCPVPPSRILSLSVRDPDLLQQRVRIESRHLRGRPGESGVALFPLPAWACSDIEAWIARLDAPPGAPLFPKKARPGSTQSINRALASACRNASIPPFTLADIRAMGQAVLKGLNAPRATIRGTAGTLTGPAWPAQLSATRRLHLCWGRLSSWPQVAPLSRRAPRGCPPNHPERAFPWRALFQRPSMMSKKYMFDPSTLSPDSDCPSLPDLAPLAELRPIQEILPQRPSKPGARPSSEPRPVPKTVLQPTPTTAGRAPAGVERGVAGDGTPNKSPTRSGSERGSSLAAEPSQREPSSRERAGMDTEMVPIGLAAVALLLHCRAPLQEWLTGEGGQEAMSAVVKALGEQLESGGG